MSSDLRPPGLTDSELDAIMNSAAPLDRDQRDPFVRAVIAELANHRGEIGDGTVHRAIRSLQPLFFRPPSDDRASSRSGTGKYARASFGRETARAAGG
jgi:hypothetical protein